MKTTLRHFVRVFNFFIKKKIIFFVNILLKLNLTHNNILTYLNLWQRC